MAKLFLVGLMVIPCLLAAGYFHGARRDSEALPRPASASGLAAILLLALLGGAWPSLVTLAALGSLPAGFILGRELIVPGTIDPRMRSYLMIAVFLSPFCYVSIMLRLLVVAD